MGCRGAVVWSRIGDDPTAAEEEVECEVRPGGMLVQRRKEEGTGPPPPRVVVRVSYGAVRFAVDVNSRATFGEMKKLLTVESGLQPSDQILIYKGKERENTDYLDLCGVKNKSKVTLVEDPCSKERRYIEMKKNAQIQTIQRVISDVAMEIDKLADQVTSIEEHISKGDKVADLEMTTLTELLMRQAVRLDSIIPVEGNTMFQKTMQAKRVQKCVETLDVLKASNEKLNSVVTTKWETFDSPPTTNWEFFD